MAVSGDVVLDRLAGLVATDLDDLSEWRELDAVLRQVAAVRAWLDAFEMDAAHTATRLAAAGHGPGPVEVLQRGGGRSSRDARTVARRAEVTAALPSFADALAEGRVSAEHVDALGRAMLSLDESRQAELAEVESALVHAAESSTPEAWARRVRGFVDELDTSHVRNELERAQKLTRLRMWHDKASRMVQMSGSIEPVAGERLWNAIRRETNRLLDADRERPAGERLTEEQAAAHALVTLVTGGHARAHPNATDLVVLVELERLAGEADCQGVCETSRGTRLPVDWVRRMAHEARILPLVVDEAGLQVEIDRASRARLASFVQRVTLRAMHDTCIVPCCDVPYDDCEIHHLVRFDGRNTRLANLAPLCRRHHHDVHDRGWRITLDADRNVTITLPDGTIWAQDEFRPPGRHPPALLTGGDGWKTGVAPGDDTDRAGRANLPRPDPPTVTAA